MELLGRRVPLDHARLDLLANYLRRGPEAERDYSEVDITWQGVTGSRCAQERVFVGAIGTKKEWTRAVNTAYASARLGLVSMGEHSLCLARLITDPELGVHGLLGAEVLCRSALEIGARVAWILDPSIGALERVVRYFVEEFNSATEYDHIESLDQGLPRASCQRAARTFEEQSTSLGLVASLNPRWQYKVDGVSRPSATEVVTDLAARTPYRHDKGIVYSLLCGATHGNTHSLLRSYVRVSDTAQGERELERFVDHRLLESTIGIVMMSYIAVLRRIVDLAGWPEYRVRSLYGMSQAVLASR